MLAFTENRRRNTGLAVTTNPRVVMSSLVSGPSGPASVQTITSSSGTISAGTDILIVNRSAPSTTAVTLPNASLRNGRYLSVTDFSSSVTAHTITLTPYQASQTVMRQSTWPLYSNTSSLAAVTLIPVVDPDDSSNYVWIIAP